MKTDGLPEGFKVRGGQLCSAMVPRIVTEAIHKLDKLPFGELLTMRQFAALLGKSCCHTKNEGMHPLLAEYKSYMQCSSGRVVLWGSKKTIKSLKQKLARYKQEVE